MTDWRCKKCKRVFGDEDVTRITLGGGTLPEPVVHMHLVQPPGPQNPIWCGELRPVPTRAQEDIITLHWPDSGEEERD